jgi:1D-myo-inositol-tetrakisphosphate 5-kinase/inositol-polyphosphate multikinase
LGTLKYGAPSLTSGSDATTQSGAIAPEISIPNITNLKALSTPLTHPPSTSRPPPGTTSALGIYDQNALRPLNLPMTHPPSSSIPPDGTASTLGTYDPGPLKGKKLDTDLHIVLVNIAANFKHPNILDLKLGSRLWADNANSNKRARLDHVSSMTTSGSLGFRMAGMRIWQGEDLVTDEASNSEVKSVDIHGNELVTIEEDSNVRVFNKFWGRTFTADSIVDAFKRYFIVPSSGMDSVKALPIVRQILEDVKQIQSVLEREETRMFSSSILLVYEGDPAAWKEAMETAASKPVREDEDEEDDDDDDDVEEDEVEEKRAWAVKLIDFAHASFTPGLGPDENILQGVRSIVRILQTLEAEFAT